MCASVSLSENDWCERVANVTADFLTFTRNLLGGSRRRWGCICWPYLLFLIGSPITGNYSDFSGIEHNIFFPTLNLPYMLWTHGQPFYGYCHHSFHMSVTCQTICLRWWWWCRNFHHVNNQVVRYEWNDRCLTGSAKTGWKRAKMQQTTCMSSRPSTFYSNDNGNARAI